MTPEALERIRKLVEAGEKATQGECFVYSERDVGMPPEVQYINGENRGTFAWCDEKDCEFITQAANTRQDLKSLLEAYEEMREAVKTALDLAEENVDDPDVYLIKFLKQTLGGNDE